MQKKKEELQEQNPGAGKRGEVSPQSHRPLCDGRKWGQQTRAGGKGSFLAASSFLLKREQCPPTDGGRGVGGLRREERCECPAGGGRVACARAGGSPADGWTPCASSNSATCLEDCASRFTELCCPWERLHSIPWCKHHITCHSHDLSFITLCILKPSPPGENLGCFQGWNARTSRVSFHTFCSVQARAQAGITGTACGCGSFRQTGNWSLLEAGGPCSQHSVCTRRALSDAVCFLMFRYFPIC